MYGEHQAMGFLDQPYLKSHTTQDNTIVYKIILIPHLGSSNGDFGAQQTFSPHFQLNQLLGGSCIHLTIRGSINIWQTCSQLCCFTEFLDWLLSEISASRAPNEMQM